MSITHQFALNTWHVADLARLYNFTEEPFLREVQHSYPQFRKLVQRIKVLGFIPVGPRFIAARNMPKARWLADGAIQRPPVGRFTIMENTLGRPLSVLADDDYFQMLMASAKFLHGAVWNSGNLQCDDECLKDLIEIYGLSNVEDPDVEALGPWIALADIARVTGLDRRFIRRELDELVAFATEQTYVTRQLGPVIKATFLRPAVASALLSSLNHPQHDPEWTMKDLNPYWILALPKEYHPASKKS